MFSTQHLSHLRIASRTSHRATPKSIGIPPRQSRSFNSYVGPMSRWSEEDTTRLLEMRESGKPWEAIHDAFPERTLDSIKSRFFGHDGTRRRNVLWTEEEHDRLLRMKADGGSWKTITSAFPGRSIIALRTRWARAAGTSGKKSVKWTPEDDARLLKLRESGELSNNHADHFPNRTMYAINRRYQLIGPRGKHGRLIHTNYHGLNDADRDQVLKLYQSGMTPTEVHAKFCPEKSIHTVRNAIKLGPRGDEMGDKCRQRQRWTRAEDKIILRMRQKEHRPFREISAEVGRSYLSTTNRYYKLTEGTVRPVVPHPKEYSAEENAKIVQMLKAKTPVKEIATAIGRTEVAIFHHLFNKRAEMGFLQPAAKSWHERRVAAAKVEKLKTKGMMWKEIQAYLPHYTIRQLKNYYTAVQSGAMQSNRDVKKTLSEKELQVLAATVKRLKLRGLNWTEIGLKFPTYSVNRVRSLYVQAKRGIDEDYTPRKFPSQGRSRSEIDLVKVKKYRAKGMTWSEIQAHMPGCSDSKLRRAVGEKEQKLKPLGKAQVRMIAKYKGRRMTWIEVHAHMPEYTQTRLRRAYAQGRKEGII